ncbi:UNVERIFIED_CONTAM: hypothetical protein Sindi_2691600 [Sesamum indicum]
MWEVYNDMVLNGLLPSSVTYEILIDASCDRGDIVKARLLLEEIIGRGLKPTVVIYTTLIHGLCIENNLLEAKKNFTRMREYGVVPNLYTYNALIDGYGKKASVEKARRVYYEMLDQGVLPNVIPYSILIYLLYKKDVVMYGILMKGYCRIGRAEATENSFCKMNKEGLMLNSVLFNTLIDGYWQLAAAMGLYNEMTIKGYKPDVVAYNALIDDHFKNGYTDAALQLHKEMMDAGIAPNIFTISSVIDGLCKDGRINNAFNFFLEQTIVEFSAETGQTFKASKFFSDMRSSGLQQEVSDYAAIIQAHFGAKHVLPVIMLKVDMVKMGILPNAFIYKVLDRGY